MPIQLGLGLALACLIGYVAYRRGSLSFSGMLGAMAIGTLVFGLGGWDWGTLLIVFFGSSSVLSHYHETQKAGLAEKFSKGSRRDWLQTLANGGAGALLVGANYFFPAPVWWVAYVAALAVVNADTWSTELGVLSREPPRLITTRQTVPVGTSGGLTRLGTQAALGGAALIGGLAAVFDLIQGRGLGPALLLALLAPLAGLFGALFDSWLGATWQAIYYCDLCQKETERHPVHTCGRPTRHQRGWRWLDNDWVNFISSVVGAGAAALVFSGFALFL